MPLTFRVTQHRALPDVQIVEILDTDRMVCGVIYPDGEQGVKIVSAHFAGDLAQGTNFPTSIRMDNGEHRYPPIPGVLVEFDPQPYTLKGGKILRQRPVKQ